MPGVTVCTNPTTTVVPDRKMTPDIGMLASRPADSKAHALPENVRMIQSRIPKSEVFTFARELDLFPLISKAPTD
jgi:hypothetical protein